MIKCVIIEDQVPAQRILKNYIADVDFLQLEGIFSDPIQGMNFLKEHAIDLVFLDIHLPKVSGIELLKTLVNKPKVIFTTAFSEYAIESYELDAVDYLLKPFSFPRFLKAVGKVEDSGAVAGDTNVSLENKKDWIFVKTGSDFIKIKINTILFVKAEGDYTFLFTADSRYLVKQTLKYWRQKFDDRFYQVHRSFLVNLAHVTRVSGNRLWVEEHEVPIGRVHKEAFFKHFVFPDNQDEIKE